MMIVMQRLKELWRGQLPLELAFWRYAITYGLALNVAATAAALVAIVLDAPIAIAVIVHLLPIPYSVVAAVGVWRSAARYSGSPVNATVAKTGVLAWFCFWLVL